MRISVVLTWPERPGILGPVFGALLLLGSHPASAQDVSGAISGTVVDETSNVLPGANVTLINERTGAARSLATDAQGQFRFLSVYPGPYTVKVELRGFGALQRRNNVLSASERLSLGTLKLSVGAVTESITVEASGARVNPEESQPTSMLTSTQIMQIQTKGRDVVNLLRLLPGVRYGSDSDSLGESFGSEIPNVGGLRRHWVHLTVDGVMGNEIGGGGRIGQTINLDAIEEVKVLHNTYRAEYGRGGGAYIQIVSKSGGTEYHGNAYYYGRHERFNANDPFDGAKGVEKGQYRYNTFGFNFGGPVKIPGLWEQKGDKKLFFHYSMETPLTKRPGDQRDYYMPTERERRGDFSRSGITIYDPLTGQPFPGNVIPSNRIHPSGQAALNMFPLPNGLQVGSRANHSHRTPTENPRLNNVLRFDWKPSATDSLFVSFKDWYSDQRGNDITVGPSRWGLFDAHYTVKDRGVAVGHTRFFGSNVINEANFGFRKQWEEFFPVGDADWAAVSRSNVGWNVSQFHPQLNPLGIVPWLCFGDCGGSAGARGGRREPNVTFDTRLVSAGSATVYSFRDNLTRIKGSHTFKGGVYAERVFNTEGKGGEWMGRFDFRSIRDNPLDACRGTVPSGVSAAPCAFANGLLGVFREYRESDAFSEALGAGYQAEWYLQDTWKISPRFTLDYGSRFLWYQPWYQTNGRAAVFDPARYDPAKAPRLYYPAKIGGKNVAIDKVTGEIRPEVYVGTFVPGTGDPNNGLVFADDPSYPKGFRENQGVHPEPRIGLAWDMFGNAKTVLHASAGLYHYARVSNGLPNAMAGNFVRTPIIYYGTFDSLRSLTGAEAPRDVDGLERDAKTASSYSWALGIQRELGWGTVIDVTYVGSVQRHLSQQIHLNRVPDGAKLLDIHPENVDPRTGRALPDVFLRPITQYGTIEARHAFGTANYNSLQVQLNRRYIKGLQFSIAYTYARALGIANDDDDCCIALDRPLKQFYYAPISHNQRHNLVVNYTWDLPKAGSSALAKALLNGWQVSGEYALVSGDWEDVVLRRIDGADAEQFFGSTGEGGREDRFRPVLVGDPTAGSSTPDRWFNVDAFARPANRFDYGNAPRTVFQEPGINNWNLSFFRNFSLGGRRNLQLRWEMYNVLNHAQFDAVNADAEFDKDGKQVNETFGRVTGARNPRIMQASIRFSF